MRNTIRRIRRSQAGDTIVEVMVVLAVLGLAIGISYATASSSLMESRQAEQNAQATELLQSQIQLLNTLASSGQIYGNGTGSEIPFCISSDDKYVPATATTDPSFQSSCESQGQNGQYNIIVYWCDGSTGNSDANSSYNYSTFCSSDGVALAKDTFVAQATWNDIAGQGSDTATLTYRLDQ